jgi:sRNA-binding protein
LRELFPALFGGAPKPIKLKIQSDIQERAPGLFSKQSLSAFFRRYTLSTGYLVALTKSKERFDLDGAPAGELSDEHRQAARDELARRRERRQAREAAEQEQRRERAQLMRDFERTTLTKANFCVLKGIEPEALEAVLELARREAAEAPPQRPPHPQRPQRPQRPREGR